MWFSSARDCRPPHLTRTPGHRFRPLLESLEDRSLLSTATLPAGYGKLPLAFTVNAGQAPPPIDYLAQGNGYRIALTATQAEVQLDSGSTTMALNMQLVGANPAATAVGQNELATKTNYLVGSNASQWLTNLANYGQVEYQNVYPGVDAVYAGNQGALKTTYFVQPGANASVIHLQVGGAHRLSLDAHGNLVIQTAGDTITESAPVLYQIVNGVRHTVTGRYVLESNGTVGLRVGSYDHSQTLVIDPTLGYSSYLPGAAWAITVSASGNTYLAGSNGGTSVYVAEMNATGTALNWITNLGGSGIGSSVAVDANGNVYVTGYSQDSSFPTTASALATTKPSTAFPGFLSILSASGASLLDSTWLPGTSGGSSASWTRTGGYALAIDHAGDASGQLDNVYLTGAATTGFPTTAGAYQPNYAGGAGSNAFLAEIDPNLSGLSSLQYGTYLGGSLNSGGGNTGVDVGTGVAVDAAGNVYLVGRTRSTNFPTTTGVFQPKSAGGMDAFVAKFNPSLAGTSSLLYSTYLGGSGTDGYWTDFPQQLSVLEPGPAIAVDTAGDAYVAGTTTSTNFPTTTGAFQTKYIAATSGTGPGEAFVTKLNPTGTGLIYSTYLGGSYNTGGTSVAVDASGNAYVTGWTRSTNFPILNAIQAQKTSGTGSAVFVTTLNSSGTGLRFSTYLGGAGGDVYGYALALDPADNVYVAGATQQQNYESASTGFPTTPGAYQTTPGGGFVAKISAVVPTFVVSGFPASATAGQSATITIQAMNNGTLNAAYTGTVQLTSSDPQAVLPADVQLVDGTGTFTVVLKTAGPQSITATDTTNGMIGLDSAITIIAGPATHFGIIAPTSVTAGVAFSVTVMALDAYGNPASFYSGTVSITTSDPTATLPSPYTYDDECYTFTMMLYTLGTQTITATDLDWPSIDGLWTILVN